MKRKELKIIKYFTNFLPLLAILILFLIFLGLHSPLYAINSSEA